jgi:hypothetical protein
VEFCQVRLEAHQHGATIYIVGLLADLAASRAETLVAQVPIGTAIIRMDLRGVQLIDPGAFVRVARSLNKWRDLRRGRVNIAFPERSARRSTTRVQPIREAQSTRIYSCTSRSERSVFQREERLGRHSSNQPR